MIFNLSDYSPTQRYHLMTQTIIPRPIAWALTSFDKGDTQGAYNLAPFSYFTAVSSAPPILMISVGKKPNGDEKDTLVNVKNSKKMVIHIANKAQADVVTETAASLPFGDSELTLSTTNELDTVPFDGFGLPRLKHCDIAYGCNLYEVKELGDVPQSLIFVEIEKLYVNDSVATNKDGRTTINAEKVQPLARLGASEYSGITSPFKKVRPE